MLVLASVLARTLASACPYVRARGRARARFSACVRARLCMPMRVRVRVCVCARARGSYFGEGPKCRLLRALPTGLAGAGSAP
eukprot:14179615-Alexandrium_andersonii.AAC.1